MCRQGASRRVPCLRVVMACVGESRRVCPEGPTQRILDPGRHRACQLVPGEHPLGPPAQLLPPTPPFLFTPPHPCAVHPHLPGRARRVGLDRVLRHLERHRGGAARGGPDQQRRARQPHLCAPGRRRQRQDRARHAPLPPPRVLLRRPDLQGRGHAGPQLGAKGAEAGMGGRRGRGPGFAAGGANASCRVPRPCERGDRVSGSVPENHCRRRCLLPGTEARAVQRTAAAAAAMLPAHAARRARPQPRCFAPSRSVWWS